MGKESDVELAHELRTRGAHSNNPGRATREAKSCEGVYNRSTKRVSINEDEARNELTKRSPDSQLTTSCPPLDVEDVLV
ncbi:hypothetical protein GCK32_006540, partial [Trichostrongylus colubriformis]